ncbi:hypothetical protein P4O66_006472 [Electrophorus voltai]|uniref:Uncharacterized protein n=1 Tax=Electrophorus voltai TaxID=2609070 RepID=A0AAD9E0P3_9TELE|nr:hypothetical protein P4O66_006472 [Electrophorus voltai]
MEWAFTCPILYVQLWKRNGFVMELLINLSPCADDHHSLCLVSGHADLSLFKTLARPALISLQTRVWILYPIPSHSRSCTPLKRPLLDGHARALKPKTSETHLRRAMHDRSWRSGTPLLRRCTVVFAKQRSTRRECADIGERRERTVPPGFRFGRSAGASRGAIGIIRLKHPYSLHSYDKGLPGTHSLSRAKRERDETGGGGGDGGVRLSPGILSTSGSLFVLVLAQNIEKAARPGSARLVPHVIDGLFQRRSGRRHRLAPDHTKASEPEAPLDGDERGRHSVSLSSLSTCSSVPRVTFTVRFQPAAGMFCSVQSSSYVRIQSGIRPKTHASVLGVHIKRLWQAHSTPSTLSSPQNRPTFLLIYADLVALGCFQRSNRSLTSCSENSQIEQKISSPQENEGTFPTSFGAQRRQTEPLYPSVLITTVALPKKNPATCFSEYRLVALTSIVMKG